MRSFSSCDAEVIDFAEVIPLFGIGLIKFDAQDYSLFLQGYKINNTPDIAFKAVGWVKLFR